MINARVETVAEKPAYAKPLRRRRLPRPGRRVYEWRKEPDGKSKTPMHIHLKSDEPFAFAGLWESWHSPDGSEITLLHSDHRPAQRAGRQYPRPDGRDR
jgi:putative SOS response-associated peptidase YedK